jgi:hypothetical protein
VNNKKISKSVGVIGIGLLALSLQGCIAAAVGAGVGAWKWGSSKTSEAETQCKKDYPNYALSMEKVNKARALRHEKAEKIMTLQEYCHLEEKEVAADKNTVSQK